MVSYPNILLNLSQEPLKKHNSFHKVRSGQETRESLENVDVENKCCASAVNPIRLDERFWQVSSILLFNL